ncbi:alpha/beta fold hydrolase [uncultured Sulfitobacter sp.]|uniref:alpha/beta fold hydrolase n=1 Tax=uncultured Sulfitobacter sp. TaxID=191468 RepID=UPI002607B131|nr:alpha/beta fold hydrolase [uncultured Sulfitobacter sp.]
MTQHLAPNDPKTKSELIESIYRIALEPQTYDSFMGHWDEFILEQISKLNTLQASTAAVNTALSETEITNHFAIAMQLLEQAGRPEIANKPETTRSSVPQLVFSSSGMLVWHNNAARTAFGIGHGATLDDFTLSDTHRTQVRELLSGQFTARTVLVRVMPADGEKPLPMAFQLSTTSAQERLFMATQVRQSWPETTGPLLASGFGLSASEIDICALLIEGQNPAEIAQTRKSALGTVRTQIKKILQKTDSSGQVELVSLLHSTMRLAEDDTPDQIPEAKIPDRVLNVQLANRVMPVETFGDPNGTPIIFFHGMLDGNTMTDRLRRLLHEHGFHLICPVRPSFGNATPDDTGPISTAPQRLARDVEVLLDTTGAKRPILLGHMAGSVYAFATAAHLGDRVRAVLNVSGGVPIVSPSQFASMSVRQRVVALTARYTPRVLPFVVRAGINQLDNAGERQFLHSLYQNSPCDMRTVADLEIRDIVVAGFYFTITQGHSAFEIDSYHVVRNWSATVADTDIPIELLHGVHDPVVSIDSVRDFQARHSNRARLTELENTGQLVLYEQPDALIEALERLRNS